MLSKIFSRISNADSENYCKTKFKQNWEQFVDHFVDSIHAHGLPAKPPPKQVPELVTSFPAAERLIAIGDLHGDFEKTQKAFRLAGLTNQRDRWIGGKTVCVQVGDQLDRGDHEVQILYFLERLQIEAEQHGGALHIMNGNHETMNINGRFRYCTKNALRNFTRWHLVQSIGQNMKQKCDCEIGNSNTGRIEGFPKDKVHQSGAMARWAALRSGGPLSMRFMARHPTVLQIGSTVFAHGGLLPLHVKDGLEVINKQTQQWISGEQLEIPEFLHGRNAVVWTREYSTENPAQCNCEALEETLSSLVEAKRMIVGHTIQMNGINSACEGRVYRVDVGMSKGCADGQVQVLEILNDRDIRLLTLEENGEIRTTIEHAGRSRTDEINSPTIEMFDY
eukprot:g7204.t1